MEPMHLDLVSRSGGDYNNPHYSYESVSFFLNLETVEGVGSCAVGVHRDVVEGTRGLGCRLTYVREGNFGRILLESFLQERDSDLNNQRHHRYS